MLKRTTLSSIALTALSIGLAAPREAGAVRLWEEARDGWVAPGGISPGMLSIGGLFTGPNTSPDLRAVAEPTPLAAGGNVGTSRFPEGVSARWLDLGFYTQPVFSYQTGYRLNSDSNFSQPPGFSVQRMRLIVHAQVHRLLQIRTEINVADTVTLLDAYALVPVRRWFQVQAGRFRVPYSRQELVSGARFQFVDRQLWAGGANANSVNFIPSYDQGLMVWGWVGPRDVFEYYVGVFNGKGATQPVNIDGLFLYAARLAVNPLGRARSLQEGAVGLPSAPNLAIAVNANTQTRQLGFLMAGTVPNRLSVTTVGADVFFSGYGASAYGELYFRDTHQTDTASAPNTQSLGWLIQAGYLLPASVPGVGNHLEVIARVQSFDPSNCYTVSAGPDCGQRLPASASPVVYRDFMFAQAFTFGLNWYQLGHGLKLQAQYTINTEHRDIAGGRPGSGVVDNDLFSLQLTGSI